MAITNRAAFDSLPPEIQRGALLLDQMADAYNQGREDAQRQIGAEADRVLAEHYTLAEIAQEPDMQAKFAQLSPAAQRTMQGWIALLDLFPLDAVERTLDRLLAAMDAPKPTPPVDFVGDDPTVTLVDIGERSGIRVERYDWSGTPPAWLELGVGDLLATVDLGGGRPGVEIMLSGWGSSRYRPLADLRQLRDDLDRLLRDERLLGALAEQTV